ncbi:colanic acid/amylovoran biosynthesis glycosyltransferase [Bizionia echini]|uniref:Colanic acid/amylovoran biosynthesis glycosyltransferase n=1 Tax=Bizionia echini TaxID=649333 RepID=A0A1I5BCJ5_9FLAO|nr:glycosyltransferase family 4 protein [Bizionia echini]SFN72432.1 colanic acid/amylovoran biosynthesis glycosyltransferase [Bizionia echini]
MTDTTRANKRIGLVLSAVPGYSETFFTNKISGLQAHGFEVQLFVTDQSGVIPDVLDCRVQTAPFFKGSAFRVLCTSSWVLLKTILCQPVRSFRHFQLDRSVGFSFSASVKRLIKNAFLLEESLDWLHFGFGMLAVGREHVATAIQARMAVSFRGFDLYLSPLKHPNCYDLLFTKNVQYHVLSEEMKGDLQANGVLESAITVITPAIDVTFFNSKPNTTELEGNSKVQLITVARLHWKKGLEYTLEALAVLRQAGVDFHYSIIGTGEERERLVFAAHQLGIIDAVTFMGQLPPEAVREQLAKSDIYLQYSIQEGFCNAVLEAQAMGLLCVVSDAEGLQENVLHQETGWVVAKRQPQLLAKQLVEVIQLSADDKEATSIRAIRRIRDDFNLKKQQAAFLAFYNT